ncbi:hypothetical protein QJS04_geneDACA006309 [Acorus gramineus]|uniref:Suppressor of RPS4-RLD 1 n=1 Tax=Acorus gramineus TaxID=55184 RepID=A0AAV9AYR6_ACOGR|nr:hypothetical protein QJS04_geneDACA006309 [Acorus gramineus]
MSSSVAERKELARLCSSKNWSKAIRILDSLIKQSPTIQDVCNRAFCNIQMEFYKHAIKDCDAALQIDESYVQAYILKGRAMLKLEKIEDALTVWEQGHTIALHQSADLKQLLELEELLATAKQNMVSVEGHAMESSSDITSASAIGSATAKQSMVSVEENAMESPSDITSASATGSATAKQSMVSVEDHAMESLSDITSASATGSGTEIYRKLVDTYENGQKIGELSEACSKLTEAPKVSRKVFATGPKPKKSISLDFRLSHGIEKVNEGRYDRAVSIFDQILRENPDSPEALIGRGTAYAFQRELNAAISDFTKAIQSNPSAGEAWKRRGQARAALREFVEAIDDLTKALELEPDSPDILHERGIVNFKFKDFDAAVKDLSSCVLYDPTNKSAYTYLGLALSSIGEYRKAEKAHLKAIEIDSKFLDGYIHLAQHYQELAKPEAAFDQLEKALLVEGRLSKAYYLRGLLRHAMGEHRKAIKDLSKGLSIESSSIECLYLRASCYHAIGEYSDAVKDYDTILALEFESMEKFVLQCLAFYQKELALYTASRMSSEFFWFNIDEDINPFFKEYWCKRLHPKDVAERVFRQPPLRDSLRKGRSKKMDFPLTKSNKALLRAADLIGKKIQYSCPGFMSNRRQHRMAGLAALEVAQKVSKFWRSLQGTNKNTKKSRKKDKVVTPSMNRGGAGCSTSGLSEPSTPNERSTSGRSMMSWQDVYNIAVKWRQISEPCDPVVWINKLGEQFKSGFGSHTPMLLGQAKVTRYFPNYQRILSVAKTIMRDTFHAYNSRDGLIDLSGAGKLENIAHAESCADLFQIVGEDFWVATSCRSTAVEEKHLVGTRITVQKMGERGYDFAIRTPCIPPRWDDYDEEMTIAWEALCNAYCGELYGSTDLDALENVKDAILRMAYYWYNFMPLSRGSAAVGYVVLLGLFLAANMEVTTSIPEGIQVDWEAILASQPDIFLDSVKQWLYPSLKINTALKESSDVASALPTTGSVVGALSSYDDDISQGRS